MLDVKQEEILRSRENHARYGYLYDAWNEESPAAMNQAMTAEIRRQLSKVPPCDAESGGGYSATAG